MVTSLSTWFGKKPLHRHTLLNSIDSTWYLVDLDSLLVAQHPMEGMCNMILSLEILRCWSRQRTIAEFMAFSNRHTLELFNPVLLRNVATCPLPEWKWPQLILLMPFGKACDKSVSAQALAWAGRTFNVPAQSKLSTTSGLVSGVTFGRLHSKEEIVQHTIAYRVKQHNTHFAVNSCHGC